MKWWVVAFLTCCIVLPVAGEDSSARLRTVTLKNGLTVLLAPDPLATTVDVAVWYRAGSRTEIDGATGLSHLFGRLMYGGSSSTRRVSIAG